MVARRTSDNEGEDTMPNYAIMRCKKISTGGGMAASMQHNFRERQTDNADPNLTHENEHLGAKNTNEAMGQIRQRLPEKRRKDAVLCVEYVMTASPEFFKTATPEQQKEFFDKSVAWLEEKYGKENVIVATIQRDELTPHLSAFVTPITKDGRLSAKEFIGNRGKMKADQTTYAKAVEHLGLVRGIEGSKAKHQRVKTHYTAVNKAYEGIPRVTPEELEPKRVKGNTIVTKIVGKTEKKEDVAERINKKIEQAVHPLTARMFEQRKSENDNKLVKSLKEQLDKMQSYFKGLNKDQMSNVLKKAFGFQKENEQEREQRKQQYLKQSKARSQSRGHSLD